MPILRSFTVNNVPTDNGTPGNGPVTGPNLPPDGVLDYFPEVVRIQQIQDVVNVPHGAIVLLKRRGQ